MKHSKNALVLTGLLMASLAVSPVALAESHAKKQPQTVTSSEVTSHVKAGAEDKAKQPLKPAKPSVSKTQDQANKKAIVKKTQSQVDLLKEVDKGILDGFKKVIEATKLIKEDKIKKAIKALQDATGKFNIALAADPKLALIPITSSVSVNELITTPKAVKAQIKLVKGLLDDSKVQAARELLIPLQDELVTRTTSLPMTTYPDAIKLATKMLVEGKKDAAETTLKTALSTFVNKVSIIPLSLLRVESMVLAASELDKEKDKDKALILMNAAEEQLQVATELGYTTRNSLLYEDLSQQIKAIKKEITGENIVEKMYSKLKDSIKSLIGKKSEQKTKNDETK